MIKKLVDTTYIHVGVHVCLCVHVSICVNVVLMCMNTETLLQWSIAG